MHEPLKRLSRSPSLYHSAQESIKDYIRENGLQAGDPLPPETELARQLGVGRSSVREAVKALNSLGILETRQGSGLFVSDFSFDPLLENLPYGLISDWRQLDEVLDVRRVLETGMIGEAIEKLTDEQLASLNQLVETMRLRAEENRDSPESDREFHNTLFGQLNNRMVLKLLDVFWLTFRKAAEQIDLRNSDPVGTYQDHAAIVQAVAVRDVKKAQTALVRHYAGLTGRLARAHQQRDGATVSS